MQVDVEREGVAFYRLIFETSTAEAEWRKNKISIVLTEESVADLVEQISKMKEGR